jgi:hypothetical protein
MYNLASKSAHQLVASDAVLHEMVGITINPAGLDVRARLGLAEREAKPAIGVRSAAL